jgi:hypothetical protein
MKRGRSVNANFDGSKGLPSTEGTVEVTGLTVARSMVNSGPQIRKTADNQIRPISPSLHRPDRVVNDRRAALSLRSAALSQVARGGHDHPYQVHPPRMMHAMVATTERNPMR